MASSLVEVTSGTQLSLSGGTIGKGAILETLSGGRLNITGTVANSGRLFASDADSTVDIAGVVNGGLVEVGDGIVNIQKPASESVLFLSTGTGGLQLGDHAGDAADYNGMVSGFGGSAHSNHNQFIDLISVTSAGLITSHYTSAAGNMNGTLTVSIGGALVASIEWSAPTR